MMRRAAAWDLGALALLVGSLLSATACAVPPPGGDEEEARAFFAGRTMTYVVATEPGGMYDTYGRLLARYLQKHLGLRTVAVKNVPGGGHIRGANEIAGARPDGLTIGTFNAGLVYAQLLGRESLRIDLTQLSWIGKAGGEPRVLVVSARSGLRSVDDMRRRGRPILLANSGFGNEGFYDSVLLAEALGFEARFVFGLTTRTGQLSMLRGEVEGQVGSASAYRSFVEHGYGAIAVRVGSSHDLDGAIPEARDLATTPHTASLLELVGTVASLTRWTAGPPGIPDARLAVLRQAYLAALQDPALHEDARTLRLPLDPLDGASLAERVRAVLTQPPDLVTHLARAVANHAGP